MVDRPDGAEAIRLYMSEGAIETFLAHSPWFRRLLEALHGNPSSSDIISILNGSYSDVNSLSLDPRISTRLNKKNNGKFIHLPPSRGYKGIGGIFVAARCANGSYYVHHRNFYPTGSVVAIEPIHVEWLLSSGTVSSPSYGYRQV